MRPRQQRPFARIETSCHQSPFLVLLLSSEHLDRYTNSYFYSIDFPQDLYPLLLDLRVFPQVLRIFFSDQLSLCPLRSRNNCVMYAYISHITILICVYYVIIRRYLKINARLEDQLRIKNICSQGGPGSNGVKAQTFPNMPSTDRPTTWYHRGSQNNYREAQHHFSTESYVS